MRNRGIHPDAVAWIGGSEAYPNLWGEVRFYQNQDNTLVEVMVWGLPENNPTDFFALHIHEGSSCTGEGFSGSSGHFNPTDRTHPNHAGDLPPLLRCGRGAYLAVCTDRFRVRDIIGRTVVIHDRRDDFISQPAGDAGEKIACGVIRRGSGK